jgi:predicted dehydrogenase
MSEQPTPGTYGLSGATTGTAAVAPVLPYLPPQPRHYRPRVGLIGCGGISEYHLRAYRAMNLDVVALCDREIARAEKRRQEFYPDASTYTDFRDVLRRDDLAVVDLALHPADRVAVIEQALRARKHVLSQKPFALDLAVGERLVALADEMGVKLAVNQNGRWAPHLAYLTAAIQAGVVGEVASVDCTLQWDHTWTAGTPFESIHHLVLFDFGIHWFDLATQFTRGRPATRVWASAARTSFQQMRPPMLAQVVIDYPDTQVRLAFNGHVRHGQEDRTVICGACGTLRSSGPSLSEQTVTLHTAAGRATPLLEGTWFTHGFQGTMGDLLCAIEDNREPVLSARHNLQSLALCFAALASADTGLPQFPGSVRNASHP